MHNTHRSYRHTAIRVLDILLTTGTLLFLASLPFHLVIKRLIPDPLGTYWKEGLLGLLVLLWSIQCVLRRRLLLTGTPLDGAALAYLGLFVLRAALDGVDQVAAWGLYVSVLYLPLFWLLPSVLKYTPWLRLSGGPPGRLARVSALLVLLVGIGAILAIGGLSEFLLDRALWPSPEITQRLGHPDFYVYGTHIRRVYFCLDSPTTLANTLAMLLPLALSLALAPTPVHAGIRASRWRWARIASAAAALLVAACIVVTFSRGIWVATALALAGMVTGVLIGRPRNLRWVRAHWRLLAGILAGLAVIGIVWGVVTIIRAPSRAPSPWEAGIVELSPAAYRAAPVDIVHLKLLDGVPTLGQAITRTWTLQDPIAGQPDTRTVIYEHPPETGKAELVYRIRVPQTGPLRPALRFAIAVSPEVWSPERGDGTSFQIHITDTEGPDDGQFVFVRYINPKHNPSDRRWRSYIVDLSPWAGKSVDLNLITTAGPVGDWAFDWGGWAHPEVVSVAPGLFAENTRAENALLRHVRSILDWARDETNRDRLAAWNLSWAAWRAAPLWGQGLGTTGVAALRTDPEHAFVTESQVLKALVELGLPGLLAVAYLWFQIGRTGYQTYIQTARSPSPTSESARLLLLGILTSLAIVFVEGWIYQNLEVKQVNAFFWSLVGLVGFLAQESKRDE